MDITEKKCKACKQVLPVANFYRHPSSPDGYQYRCRKCEYQYKLDRNKIRDEKARAKIQEILKDPIIPKGKQATKSPALLQAEVLYKQIKALGSFKANVTKKVMVEVIYEILNQQINLKFDSEFQTENVLSYNKAELRKDLIKAIKGGNMTAANTIIDLDGMNSKSDEILIVPLNFSECEYEDIDSLVKKWVDSNE